MPEYDYDFIASLSDEKLRHALSEKDVAVLLTQTGMAHIPAIWGKPEPTATERNNIDAWASSAESGLLNVDQADDLSPYWDDNDGADAEGTPAVSTYSWNERIEDWAIAAFVATSGVPGAAVEYLTIAPRFRLLFKTGDWGGIARIFIDDVLFTEVDTFADVAGLLPVDIVIPA